MPSFLDAATPGIQALQPYQPGKPIDELEREYGISDAVKLASNENPLGPSFKALAALRDNIGVDLGRYPDGNGFALKQALAARHHVDMGSITLGNGSNDVLDLIARAFVAPGQGLAFCQYAFAVYPIAAQAVSAKPQVAPVLADYFYDLDAICDTVDETTKVLFIANPNNPTGTWLNESQLRSLLERLPDNVLVVIDQAYVEYTEHLPDFPDASQWLRQYPNLIVTQTFSKAFGLAGLRVGYALSSPEIADVLNRVRQPFNVNSLALLAAETALKDQEHLDQSISLNQTGMRQYQQAFEDLGLAWIPSAGNFITVDLGRPAAPIYEAMLRQAVITRPVANYQLPQHLRISIGLEVENKQCIAALRHCLTNKES